MTDLNLPWSYSIEDGAIRDSAHNVVVESVNPFIGEKIVVAMNVKALCDEIIACDKMSRDVAERLAKLAEEMQAGTIREGEFR